MKFFVAIIFLLTLVGCSTVSKSSFQKLKIGMSKEQVGKILGPMSSPSKVHESASGNGKTNHVYGKSGYLWFDKEDRLEGFAAYKDLYDQNSSDQKIVIDRASGYKVDETENKKSFLAFQNYNNFKSNEANLVFLQNKKNIEKFFSNKGYSFVKNPNKADVIIVVKLGISDPKNIIEVSSTPVYHFNYKPAQTSTSNIYGNAGEYLGSVKTTTNPYGSYTNKYAGQKIHAYSRKEYFRSLELVCVRNNIISSKKEILWSAVATSSGRSDDLREIFPFLFYAASNVVETSDSFKNFELAWFHTGVRELVGQSVPRQERNPAETK